MTLVILAASAGITVAQGPGEGLTDEQKAALDEKKTELKEAREAFKATLSEEQLAILENSELTREEKMETFFSLLRSGQKAIKVCAMGERAFMAGEKFVNRQ